MARLEGSYVVIPGHLYREYRHESSRNHNYSPRAGRSVSQVRSWREQPMKTRAPRRHFREAGRHTVVLHPFRRAGSGPVVCQTRGGNRNRDKLVRLGRVAGPFPLLVYGVFDRCATRPEGPTRDDIGVFTTRRSPVGRLVVSVDCRDYRRIFPSAFGPRTFGHQSKKLTKSSRKNSPNSRISVSKFSHWTLDQLVIYPKNQPNPVAKIRSIFAFPRVDLAKFLRRKSL